MIPFQPGDQFEQTFHVNESVYQGFIEIFNDKNPLHTDQAFALASGFSDKVMHGNILNGFLSYFIGECLPTKNVVIHTQEILYKNPIYLNDKLLFDATVAEVVESVGVAIFKFTFKNEEEKIIAKGKIQIGILK